MVAFSLLQTSLGLFLLRDADVGSDDKVGRGCSSKSSQKIWKIISRRRARLYSSYTKKNSGPQITEGRVAKAPSELGTGPHFKRLP